MTKENKFKIGLALQGIALMSDEGTYERIKDKLKEIEEIVSAEPDDTTQNCVEKCVENALGALDCISRQAVLDELNKWEWQELYLPIHFKENIIDVVPSVTPQEPKTGHWIEQEKGVVMPFWERVICSECKSIGEEDFNYCPNCGCRMVEPQESEDKG